MHSDQTVTLNRFVRELSPYMLLALRDAFWATGPQRRAATKELARRQEQGAKARAAAEAGAATSTKPVKSYAASSAFLFNEAGRTRLDREEQELQARLRALREGR